jgi:hypothetical protein
MNGYLVTGLLGLIVLSAAAFASFLCCCGLPLQDVGSFLAGIALCILGWVICLCLAWRFPPVEKAGPQNRSREDDRGFNRPGSV